MPAPLTKTEQRLAMEIGDKIQETPREPRPRPDQQEPSLSLRERVFRILEEITTPKGT